MCSSHSHTYVICDTRDTRELLNVDSNIDRHTQLSNLQIMPPYDDWNNIDEEEDEELQDTSVSTWLQEMGRALTV